MRNIVILISGSGSNMAAIALAAQRDDWAHKLQARVCAVISNRPDAKGLQMAVDLGLPTQVVSHQTYATQPDPRAAFDHALMHAIDAHQPALVLLAGFMRILTPIFVAHYAGRLINIHPSLLPAFTGLHTHARALAAGCRFAGATVHRVTEVLDQGEILEQSVVPVLPGDSEASLAARVLATEHQIYPRALRRLLQARER